MNLVHFHHRSTISGKSFNFSITNCMFIFLMFIHFLQIAAEFITVTSVALSIFFTKLLLQLDPDENASDGFTLTAAVMCTRFSLLRRLLPWFHVPPCTIILVYCLQKNIDKCSVHYSFYVFPILDCSRVIADLQGNTRAALWRTSLSWAVKCQEMNKLSLPRWLTFSFSADSYSLVLFFWEQQFLCPVGCFRWKKREKNDVSILSK